MIIHKLRHPSKDRRAGIRYQCAINMELKYRGKDGTYEIIDGIAVTAGTTGIGCQLRQALPLNARFVQLTIHAEAKSIQGSGHIVWRQPGNRYGLEFEEVNDEWHRFLKDTPSLIPVTTRRTAERRIKAHPVTITETPERRTVGRRFPDFIQEAPLDDGLLENPALKTFLRSKAISHTPEIVKARRKWAEEYTSVSLEHIGCFSEEIDDFKGKIENPIGVAHTPLGIAGPLQINGDYARGTFLIPLATMEGALVTSYTLGSHIITRSGGAAVALLKDELRVAPMFVFSRLREARAFVHWIKRHFEKLKQIAESTSGHLTLNDTSSIINGRRVILNFHYRTADAMGMNMACNATEKVCQFIQSTLKPEEFWLRSNFNANKKVSANNFINGYGKTVTGEVTIPRKLITMLRTTPEDMERYFKRTLLANTHAVQIGANGHFANGLTALFIACGQDVATIGNASAGISTCEVTPDGDLYFSVYIPNLLIGTVGGGTAFGTAKECLAALGCFGSGKAQKFAEIAAGVALAGEIGVCASIVNGTYVYAHEIFGKNRPKISDRNYSAACTANMRENR